MLGGRDLSKPLSPPKAMRQLVVRQENMNRLKETLGADNQVSENELDERASSQLTTMNPSKIVKGSPSDVSAREGFTYDRGGSSKLVMDQHPKFSTTHTN